MRIIVKSTRIRTTRTEMRVTQVKSMTTVQRLTSMRIMENNHEIDTHEKKIMYINKNKNKVKY